MNFAEIMQNIGSVRDFKSDFKKIGDAESISKDVNTDFKNENVSVLFFKNGNEIQEKLSGKAGYFGNFIKAPAYMVFTGDSYEKVAYATEMARFMAYDKKIGTCWITVNNVDEVRQELHIPNNYKCMSIIALGEPDAGFLNFNVPDRSGRLASTEIVYIEKWGNTPEYEELEQRGLQDVFFYTRCAPSYENSQPWKFIVEGDNIILALEKAQENDMDLNSGLVSFYFTKACEIAGYHVKIKDDELDLSKYEIPDSYIVKKVFTF